VSFLLPRQTPGENFIHMINQEKRRGVSPKNPHTKVFLNVCCVMVFYVFLCRSVCWFLYGLFCHGALKLDISTLFTTFFL